jgi:hypothetical protein
MELTQLSGLNLSSQGLFVEYRLNQREPLRENEASPDSFSHERIDHYHRLSLNEEKTINLFSY